MTNEQMKEIINSIQNGFTFIGERLEDVQQMIKAVGLAQIELPNGYDVNTALKQININFEGC